MNLAQCINCHRGDRFTIVGKGKTRFDYVGLAEITGPIAFINDAVHFAEQATSASARYFFAHEPCQAVHVHKGMCARAVLPRSCKPNHSGKKMFTWETIGAPAGDYDGIDYAYNAMWYDYDIQRLGQFSRDEIVRKGLTISAGTLLTVTHFIWFCGGQQVTLIGCDAHNAESEKPAVSYDRRIPLPSGCSPRGEAGEIKRRSEHMAEVLGLAFTYIGTPEP